MSSSLPSITEAVEFQLCGGDLDVALPLEEARNAIGLRPDLAAKWVLRFALDEGADGAYILQSELDLFDAPQNAGVREALNLCFLDLDDDLLFAIFDRMASPNGFKIPADVTQRLELITDYLKLNPQIMSGFPVTSDGPDLIKVSHAAKLIGVSETKLRSMAKAGEIEYTRTHGESGHYRFRREWLNDFLEKERA